MKNKLTKKIPSSTEHLQEVRDFISEAAVDFGFSDEDASKIVLAVDEACSNIIRHAYNYSPNKNITITVIPGKGKFEISIIDQGHSFNPEIYKQPDIKKQLHEHRRGGLGMYLMKTLMDNVEYQFNPGIQNEVRLIKYLQHSR
jgi:serine/threonine-protein kinase RsbW